MTDFGNAGAWCREIWQKYIHEGDTVIDATMGNGHDTLYLAQAVGESGRVYAFDVQKEALEKTRARLEKADVLDRVTLICENHALMEKHVSCEVDAVIFNLGWLPGALHDVTTNADTTIEALKAALRLVKAGGFVTLCVYPGHAEGERELEKVAAFVKDLDDKCFDAVSRGYENIRLKPPKLFAIAKKQ